jgi:plastocyanin
LALLGPGLGNAWGGGGCHGTDAGTTGVTDATGTTVEMVDACFTPTILRVAPGTRVTFVNRDPMIHTVTANDWGQWGDMSQGDRFSTTFQDEGVYPYACSYHPGMSGAIVVGDGVGSGTALTPASTGAAADPPAATAGSSGWLAAGVSGLGIGLAAGVGITRSRARATAANA